MTQEILTPFREVRQSRRVLFAYEKLMEEPISLPRTMHLWPSLYRDISLHSEQRGGTLANALKWAARYGSPILLENSGLADESNRENESLELRTATIARLSSMCRRYDLSSDALLNRLMEVAGPMMAALGKDVEWQMPEAERKQA